MDHSKAEAFVAEAWTQDVLQVLPGGSRKLSLSETAGDIIAAT